MNVERLHAVLAVVNREIEKRRTADKLQELINNLQRLINQNHPSHQQQLANSLKEMSVATVDSPSDSFSPTWRQIIEEIGGDELLGNALQHRIDEIFAKNQITLAVALEELQILHTRLQEFKSSVSQSISAFKRFKIGDESLAPGDCEIGILIPRSAVDNQLLDFSEELKDLGFILNTLSEVATGKKDALEIKTISTSDLLIHLKASAPYAACVAVCIERVVALYKQLLEIRKLSAEIRKQGVPDDKTVGIEEHANSLMETGIEKIAIDVVSEFHKKDDKHRKNELTTAVRIALNRVANRIDKGFNLEVRAAPVPEPEEGEEKATNSAELLKATQTIQAAMPSMQFMNLEGRPILHLPEGQKKTKKDE